MSGDVEAEELVIIVHPASPLTDGGVGEYWTEVPALPACTEVGTTVEQALSRTDREIERWLNAVASDRSALAWPRRIEFAL